MIGRKIGRKILDMDFRIVAGFVLGCFTMGMIIVIAVADSNESSIVTGTVENERILERFRYWWFGKIASLDLVFQYRDSSAIYSLEVCEPLGIWRWDRSVFRDIWVNEPLFFYVVGNPWHGIRITHREIKKFYIRGESMNEQDREIVEGAKLLISSRIGASDLVHVLVSIIDRLDKQLTNLVEAGEPFVRFYGRILYMKDENMELTIPPPDEHIDKVTYKEWGRLVKAIKEVKDE